MTQGKNGHRDSKRPGNFNEKRVDKRYHVPVVYKQHVKLQVRSGNAFEQVDIGNFSRRGILFVSPVRLEMDSSVDCVISIAQLLAKEVSFCARIKHCVEKNGSFLIGANIESVADTNWFEVFAEVHDFVMRQHDSR
jgi:PilZ domain